MSSIRGRTRRMARHLLFWGWAVGLVVLMAARSDASVAAQSDAASIEGRITRADTGEPVVAEVVVEGGDARSDAEGFYRIDGLVAGDQIVIEIYSGSDLEWAMRTLVLEPGVNTVDVALQRLLSGAVTGVVTNAETGDPIANHVVHVFGTGTALGSTDEDGRYLIEGVNTGTGTVDAGDDIAWQKVAVPVVVSDSETSTVDLVLVPLATIGIEGRVISDSGEPVVGELVHVLAGSNGFLAIAETDADGFYSSVGLPAGPATVSAGSGPEWSGVSMEVDVADNEILTVDIVLTAQTTAIVQGRVVTTADEPVVGELVHVLAGANGLIAIAETDSAGFYRHEGLPPGPATIGLSSEVASFTIAGGEMVTIDLIVGGPTPSVSTDVSIETLPSVEAIPATVVAATAQPAPSTSEATLSSSTTESENNEGAVPAGPDETKPSRGLGASVPVAVVVGLVAVVAVATRGPRFSNWSHMKSDGFSSAE